MGAPTSSTKAFKQGFLRSFLLSLTSCRNGAMGLQERKRAVRSSADIAMATTRGSGAMWPQALLAAASSSSSPSWSRRLPAAATAKTTTRRKNMARRRCPQRRRTTSSGEIARRLVRKRTKVLRGMVPGGELLDGASLLREAMDYVVHLRAQVAVLRRVSNAMQQRPSSIHMAGAVAPPVQLKTETTGTAQHSEGNEE
ncbi:transcription factor IBH1-like 1 [Triticum dicoccoides]|uniref:transcription factor IBH1-like 1 n=1 Tax=Triticum dicoccoides TaxID=85692 RepID=UPI00189123CF|nr:transcription factor IBH1-like 1 [Triticum dicoccoides]